MATLFVDLEDLDVEAGAELDDFRRVLDVMVGQFRNVDQTFDAVEDLDESTEGDDLGDRALEHVARTVGRYDPLPRILLGLLETQRDALAVAVDVEHLDLDRVADRHHLGGVIDVAPGKLGDVNQAVDAFEVHESAEVDDVRDLAFDDFARLQAIEDLVADFLTLLFEDCAAESTTLLRLRLSSMTLHSSVVDMNSSRLWTRRMSTSEAGRKPRMPRSRIRPPLTTSITLPSTGSPFSAAASILRHGLLEAGTLLGKDQPAFGIFLGDDQGVDLFAEFDLFREVSTFLRIELAGRNYTFRLVADVEQDFVAIDADDFAVYDVAFLEQKRSSLRS